MDDWVVVDAIANDIGGGDIAWTVSILSSIFYIPPLLSFGQNKRRLNKGFISVPHLVSKRFSRFSSNVFFRRGKGLY